MPSTGLSLSPRPKARPSALGAWKPTESFKIDGVVKQLNYARGGEVNGAILESGDFVFVGPKSAEELKLAVGQKAGRRRNRPSDGDGP